MSWDLIETTLRVHVRYRSVRGGYWAYRQAEKAMDRLRRGTGEKMPWKVSPGPWWLGQVGVDFEFTVSGRVTMSGYPRWLNEEFKDAPWCHVKVLVSAEEKVIGKGGV